LDHAPYNEAVAACEGIFFDMAGRGRIFL